MIFILKADIPSIFAHGKPHEWSDIDLALVADEFKSIGHVDKDHFILINIKPDYSIISARTYNTKHFTPRIDPFVEVIMEKGIEISCK